MEQQQPWHRLFGLSWMDFFRGLPVNVEIEKDLSLKRQLLDVVILRKDSVVVDRQLPDGFEDLAAHNLITFKSYQESLDGWALTELLGHYVNYRKQVSPSMQDLLPETDFRLFAVCVRFPASFAKLVELSKLYDGVYDAAHYTGKLRIVVVNQLRQQQQNAMLHLFSAQSQLVRYGAEHYQQRSHETSTLLLRLFGTYRQEGMTMPDALQELAREVIDELLNNLTVEERLKGVPVEERLKGVPVEERFKGVSVEERLEGLSPEERLKGLSPDDLRAAISPEIWRAISPRPGGNDPSKSEE